MFSMKREHFHGYRLDIISITRNDYSYRKIENNYFSLYDSSSFQIFGHKKSNTLSD